MPTLINLDLDTLRTLVVTHDLGGLAQAAEHLGRTPSAISLQMKRLHDDLAMPLFRKQGRGLALTEAGEVALKYARRMLTLNDELLDTMQGANLAGYIRIGCPQDFAFVLPSVLSHFALLYPRMQIELRVEGNAALADAVARSQIDIAIVIGHEEPSSAQILGKLEVVWIASPTFAPMPNQPLPLAVLGPKCAFRKCAIHWLEVENKPHRIAANSPSLDGLWAALLGGLGITARTALNLPEGLVCAGSLHNLPSLGFLPVTLHRNSQTSGVAMERMASLLASAITSLPLSKPHAKAPRKAQSREAGQRSGKTGMHKRNSSVR